MNRRLFLKILVGLVATAILPLSPNRISKPFTNVVLPEGHYPPLSAKDICSIQPMTRSIMRYNY